MYAAATGAGIAINKAVNFGKNATATKMTPIKTACWASVLMLQYIRFKDWMPLGRQLQEASIPDSSAVERAAVNR